MSSSFELDFMEGEGGAQLAPAVASVVQLVESGDLDGAVRWYEDSGGSGREALLHSAESASFETRKSIARVLSRARDFDAAARVFQLAGLNADAAGAFEQAGDFVTAGDCWARSGEVLKAAAAFERGGKLDLALDHYRQARAADRAAHCLSRGQHFAEAAAQFRELKNAHAEIETLKSGLAAEPGDAALASRLAELLLRNGRKDQANRVLVETARRSADAMKSARFLTQLAAGAEAAGKPEAAAKIRARLRELPPEDEIPTVTGTLEVPPAAGPPELPLTPGADAYGFLKALPMFADLSLADMKALYLSSTLKTFAPGEHLIETGQAGKGLFVIVDGQVEVFGGPDAGSRLLNTLGVGGYVGEISLVREGPTSARVTARSAVRALFISRDAFNQYIYGTPTAALCIYRLFTWNLAERVRVLSAAS